MTILSSHELTNGSKFEPFVPLCCLFLAPKCLFWPKKAYFGNSSLVHGCFCFCNEQFILARTNELGHQRRFLTMNCRKHDNFVGCKPNDKTKKSNEHEPSSSSCNTLAATAHKSLPTKQMVQRSAVNQLVATTTATPTVPAITIFFLCWTQQIFQVTVTLVVIPRIPGTVRMNRSGHTM